MTQIMPMRGALVNGQMPLVSVIMPAYNAQVFIRESIESVLNQTYPHWELIVIDDCSQDATPRIVNEYVHRDARVNLLRQSDNRGPAAARNIGLEEASGEYIALLDSDDVWLPDKLARQISFMQAIKADISCTAYRRMSADSQRIGKIIKAPEVITYHVLLKNTCIANLTTIVRREAIDGTRFKDIGHEDYAFWLELLRRGLVVAFLDADLARYRVVDGSVSSKKTRTLVWIWFIYRRIEKLNVGIACWYMGNYAVKALLKRIPTF